MRGQQQRYPGKQENWMLGAKGIGEPVMLPIAPAILNAIYDAVGVRILELPVTRERMLGALRKAGKGPEREPDQV